ncbi:hypothetical protein [Ramlibacter pallidus]|uniref:DUF2946 domain-containing protein n=1 Tax=Ramlibacter pallidus TaxID=2780087 RepID=A0ABR9S502_9BURK|nr:hypothetical protein [Ramlibacter pallidus]MBE7368592.1 hypothetical protein [Ramlibacter pallidus]
MPALSAPPSTPRRIAVAMLLLVLVLAQTLGWVHRSLHGSATEGWRHGSPLLTAVAAESSAAAAVQDLFSTHADTSDCRLFDVLGQPGCAPAPLVALPALVPATFIVLTHAEFVARWAALFDARGPPASR